MFEKSRDLRIEEVDVDGAVRETAAEATAVLAEAGDTRLDFFKKAGLAGGATVGGGVLLSALVPNTALAGGRPPRDPFGKGDIGILNYALTLEYLEAAFYVEASKNHQQSAFLTGEQLPVFLETVTRDEKAHVKALEGALGNKAIKKPKFDFGPTTSDEMQFIATSVALENTGVKAYSGQALNIEDKQVIKTALSILTVEARHASVIGLIEKNQSKGIVPDGPFDKRLSAKKVLAAVEKTGFIKD